MVDARALARAVFALKREQAACQRPDLDIYDSLLDEYEPGTRWPIVAATFAELRQAIVPLVRECVESPLRRATRSCGGTIRSMPSSGSCVRWPSGLVSTSAADASTPPTIRSARRWGPTTAGSRPGRDEHFLPTALFGVLHEAGHGLYEQGLPRAWFGLPPGEAASLGIHESQSRLWENLVGRSRSFWEWCLPLAHAAFPESLADVTVDDIHRSLLVVEPSFIRVEADEVTYNLHIMLRFDLERAVIHGDLPVADLPAAWNERFEKDFGRRPPTDAEGAAARHPLECWTDRLLPHLHAGQRVRRPIDGGRRATVARSRAGSQPVVLPTCWAGCERGSMRPAARSNRSRWWPRPRQKRSRPVG